MLRNPLPFLFAISLLAISSCSHAPEQQKETVRSATPTIAVSKALKTDLDRRLTLTAEFTPFEEVDVMAKVAGYVKQIYVDVGSRVAQGQALADLEVPEMRADMVRAEEEIQRRQSELERAKDDIKRAQSAYNLTHLSYERVASVVKSKPGLIAQQEIDEARGKDLMADAQLASSKSNLSVAEHQVHVVQADLDRLKTMYAYTKVTAPFAGVVTKRYANTGSMIQAGIASQSQAMPLVRLSNNSRLRLILPVPESAVPSIRIGNTVDVKVPTLNRTFPGRVARFSEKVQTATRTMDTEVDVANPSMTLIPGMYAEVELMLDDHRGVIAVPIAAKSTEGDHTVVFVVNASKQIEIRRVQIGLETADLAEIRSGVSVGELVVIGNRTALKDGQKVETREVQIGQALGGK